MSKNTENRHRNKPNVLCTLASLKKLISDFMKFFFDFFLGVDLFCVFVFLEAAINCFEFLQIYIKIRN